MRKAYVVAWRSSKRTESGKGRFRGCSSRPTFIGKRDGRNLVESFAETNSESIRTAGNSIVNRQPYHVSALPIISDTGASRRWREQIVLNDRDRKNLIPSCIRVEQQDLLDYQIPDTR